MTDIKTIPTSPNLIEVARHVLRTPPTDMSIEDILKALNCDNVIRRPWIADAIAELWRPNDRPGKYYPFVDDEGWIAAICQTDAECENLVDRDDLPIVCARVKGDKIVPCAFGDMRVWIAFEDLDGDVLWDARETWNNGHTNAWASVKVKVLEDGTGFIHCRDGWISNMDQCVSILQENGMTRDQAHKVLTGQRLDEGVTQ